MTSNECFLIVGSGSIARRHMRNIQSTYPQAKIVCVSASGRELNSNELPSGVSALGSLHDALQVIPTFAIIASPAPLHVEQASLLASSGVSILVEKPLSDSLVRFASQGGASLNGKRILVAYNLRFMPSIRVFKQYIDSGKLGRIHSVSCEVGQYLPDWRPDSDYRKNVSAQRTLGGGALLELSHELDYLQWLFGPVANVYCIARISGALELDAEDTVDALLVSQKGYVINLHMDFLQRTATRKCKVVGEHASLEWNILDNSVVLYSSLGKNKYFTVTRNMIGIECI